MEAENKSIKMEDKIKVLFVCLGNICRSPSAEAVFLDFIRGEGLEERFEVDSAGLSGYHQGERADGRMRAHAARRGYELLSISRQITYDDYYHYDYIVYMDASNWDMLKERYPSWEGTAIPVLMTDWHPSPAQNHIPDPYYGGAEGFERVLDLIESCVPFLVWGMLEGRRHK